MRDQRGERLEREAGTQTGLDSLRAKESHRKALNQGMPVTRFAF